MLNQFAVEILHVTSRPVSFPTYPIPEGIAKPFYQECRAAEKGRQAFGTHMVYRETFLQIQMRPLQHLITQELHRCNSSIEGPLHSSTVEKE